MFGPDGRTHGQYDKQFLHKLFDTCPRGATTYVAFGNRETLEDSMPKPTPAFMNARDFRTIFTKMDSGPNSFLLLLGLTAFSSLL